MPSTWYCTLAWLPRTYTLPSASTTKPGCDATTSVTGLSSPPGRSCSAWRDTVDTLPVAAGGAGTAQSSSIVMISSFATSTSSSGAMPAAVSWMCW